MTFSSNVEAELKRMVAKEADRLAAEFTGSFDRATIDRIVDEALQTFSGRPTVTTFVPMLVRRYARERLLALRQ
ncbi:hypothetical protein J0H33_05740 [bacterium]|nr:hypothetical protein [bacterium]